MSVVIGQSIDNEEFKHQKNQMKRQADEHRFELDVRVVFQSVLRVLEKNYAPNKTSNNDKTCDKKS